ncbi:mono/diheme cytochrome c family protein [Paraburkholderia sp. GAS199]|uniref:c-type cytochrome n=1 Tax=Paraburkholderia sp. GAS199 TaxID=3035126 RepID=UPI003D1BAB3A
MRTRTLIGSLSAVLLAGAAFLAWDHTDEAHAQDKPQNTPAHVAAALSASHSGNGNGNGDAAQDAVRRGLYLARAGDCIACHTAEGGKPFAGGLPLQTPFGKIVASNITPDRQTGIGTWTDAEFIRAVKEGRGKHGEFLYPAMPYTAYAKVSDQDLRDIKAYLDTVPAVNNKVEANQLPFPFNIRMLMFGWNLLFFDNTPFRNDDRQSVEWNRGAYLVEGLGHCASCHTAKNFLGGDKAALQGGALQGWYAPEITGNAYTGLGKWSTDEIVEYLHTGGNNRSVASGPMAEAVTNSLQHMSPADLRAVAVYLKSLPGSDRKAPAALAASDATMTLGHALFMANCAACHRSSGQGVTGMVSSLADSAGARAPDPANMLRTILIGSRGAVTQSNPTGAAMPNFSWKLSDGDIAAISTYVRNSWGNAAPAVSADDVKKARGSLGAQMAIGVAQSQ